MPLVVTDYFKDCENIVEWSKRWYKTSGNKNFHTTFSSVPITPISKIQRWISVSEQPVIESVKNKIFSDFSIKNYFQGAIINYYPPGTKVGSHAHSLEHGKIDLRFNILLQAPDSGGNPIIDGRKYCIRKGDLLVFDSRVEHETDIVEGNTDRILLSCIFVISEKELPSLSFLAKI